ncbi:MAG: enoyl-CoA hydratase/isomerase family protein [Actinobacteria bacterium]|nr:enoyl-CoA hydratase/isomerase family protein [Actinomycetota bacterium]
MAKIETEDRDGVRVLRVNRPEVHNCIDAETATQLEAAIESFGADDGARVLVLTGAGDRAFCTGADLKAVQDIAIRPGRERSSPLGFARLDPGKPTIAAVNGYCFAGGLELAAWCDIRIALIDGGTQRLPRIMGLGNALYLIEAGVRIGAERALQLGLVQEVVAEGRALDRALELARAIAAYPQVSVRGDRQAALATFGMGLAGGLEEEAEIGAVSLTDPDLPGALGTFVTAERPEAPRG